jgi:hypothetical protein
MKTFAINEARKPARIGRLALVSGALLGSIGAVGPALSADLPDDYRPGYYRDSYNYGYYNNCYRCYCCGWRPHPVAAPWPVEERPFPERFPVSERYWIQRDYVERHYPYSWPRYEYPPYWSPYRYSNYYPGPRADYPGPRADYPGPRAELYPPYEPAPRGDPPRPVRYGGNAYPPAPAAYDHEAEPRTPYRYTAWLQPHDYRRGYEYDYYRPSNEYRPVYEYEPSPRPPAPVPSRYDRGYSGPGNSE